MPLKVTSVEVQQCRQSVTYKCDHGSLTSAVNFVYKIAS